MQEFQKEFGTDVTKSLKKMETIDLKKEEPQRVLSIEADAAKKATEQKGYDMKYQEEYSQFLDRKQKLKEDMMKAYTSIFTNYMMRGATYPCGGTPRL